MKIKLNKWLFKPLKKLELITGNHTEDMINKTIKNSITFLELESHGKDKWDYAIVTVKGPFKPEQYRNKLIIK